MNSNDAVPTSDFWLIEPRPAEETQAILEFLYGNPDATALEYSTRAFENEPMVKHHMSALRTYRQQISRIFRQSRALPRMLADLTSRNVAFIKSQFRAKPNRFSRQQVDEISWLFTQFESELLEESNQDRLKRGAWEASAAQFRSLINSIRKAEGKTLIEFLREDPADRNNPSPSSQSRLTSFPNPFNPVTTIAYELPGAHHVLLRVYDMMGREVVTLINGLQHPGFHSVQFDGTHLGSGLYFARLETQSGIQVHKLVLLK